jgi:Skp family chaperone for outer membrane proteins
MKYLLFAVLFFVFACSKEKEAYNEDTDPEWAEMEEFHTVIADVYHPLKDSNNLEPIKKDHAKVFAAASKWKGAKLPSKVDNDEMKEMLTELENQAAVLNTETEAKADDATIAKDLTTLHDTFHSIMEKWYEAGKEEGAEEHHEHH